MVSLWIPTQALPALATDAHEQKDSYVMQLQVLMDPVVGTMTVTVRCPQAVPHLFSQETSSKIIENSE